MIEVTVDNVPRAWVEEREQLNAALAKKAGRECGRCTLCCKPISNRNRGANQTRRPMVRALREGRGLQGLRCAAKSMPCMVVPMVGLTLPCQSVGTLQGRRWVLQTGRDRGPVAGVRSLRRDPWLPEPRWREETLGL